MYTRKRIVLIAIIALGIAPNLNAAPFDLSTWGVVQYDIPGAAPVGNWVLGAGNTTVTQTANADASIFLSDFSIDHASHPGIVGDWRVNTPGDDDIFGIVFGYQGRGQYYLFDWKQADQANADGGMHLRVMNVAGGADPTFDDLAGGLNTANMQILRQNDLAWSAFTDYRFDLSFDSNGFSLLVSDLNSVLANWIIDDTTFTTGQLGFFNNSQPSVLYSAGQVPLPAAFWLFGTALIGFMCLSRRRKL